MGQHAFLSPSAAHRWLHCTAAPALESRVEDSGSTYAEEGTLAHAYCALKLKRFLHRDTSGEEAEIDELHDRYYSGEMDEYTDTYQSIVLEKYNTARALTRDARLLVEARLSFERYMPEAFGTADAVVIADGMMEVIDFKYGKGVKVSAWENPQMKIYALGAYEAYSDEYRIDRVRMTIVQPRIDNLSEFEMDVDDLLAWAENDLKPKAREAFSGHGRQEPGDWCRFCKVKSVCRALTDYCIISVNSCPNPPLMAKEYMETLILPRLETIKTWLTSVEAYVLEQALAGVEYRGFKVVEGRSVRKITDPVRAEEALKGAGYAPDDYLKPPELKTITELEKALGRKTFAALLGDCVSKPQGKPTLVPDTDKRPVFNAAQDDFKDINV